MNSCNIVKNKCLKFIRKLQDYSMAIFNNYVVTDAISLTIYNIPSDITIINNILLEIMCTA